ncbi:hypothetical protein Hanom_Chr09g00772771 [Helianthus anomalus]
MDRGVGVAVIEDIGEKEENRGMRAGERGTPALCWSPMSGLVNKFSNKRK